MLNGKFYTGLTAKQIDRCGNSQNRLESHFFWPDDTKAVSAAEARLKRRASLQYDQTDKPRVQRQASVEECDADTKSRFHKEFAKSSIQFYDNLEEQPENEQRQDSRRQAILKAKSARREITLKPTATKLELPEKIIDEEYTTAKKQQTYNSKIKFYDYTDEGLNNSNKSNTKKLIDMNDKWELERNAKNSPKLQIKRSVSSFSDVEDVQETKFRNDILHADPRDSKRGRAQNNAPQGEKNNRNRRGVHESFADTNHPKTTYRNEEKPERIIKIRQNNNYSKYQNNNSPQRSLRHLETKEPYYLDDDQTDLNYIENNMRNVRIHSRPTKHVTYQDTYDDHMDDDFSYERHNAKASSQNRNVVFGEGSPKQRPGSNQHQLRRRAPTPEYYDENINAEEELQYMETCHSPMPTKNYHNNISKANNSNKSDSNSNNNKNNNSQATKLQVSPKMSITNAAAAAATSPTTTSDMELLEPTISTHKHLRSNIFLNDSIPTSTTPTSKLRRFVRNSAVQRVSVGLPD